jgi:hypothetical protein
MIDSVRGEGWGFHRVNDGSNGGRRGGAALLDGFVARACVVIDVK